MTFEVEERFYKYSVWLKIWEVIRGYLLIFAAPFVLAYQLIKRLSGYREPELREQNKWLLHWKHKDLKLFSIALSNEKSTKLFDSNLLDFPNFEDWDDPFRFVLKLKTEPFIEGLENKYFDEIDLKTENGIYLIRINKKGHGMTMCYLSGIDKNIEEIINLKPLSWVIEQDENANIRLTGFADKGKHVIGLKLID